MKKEIKEKDDITKKPSKKKIDPIAKNTLATFAIITLIFLAIIGQGAVLKNSTITRAEIENGKNEVNKIFYKKGAEWVRCGSINGCNFLDKNCKPSGQDICYFYKKAIDSSMRSYLYTMIIVDAFILAIGFFILYSRKSK